jgi:hypothetical protein
VPYERKEIGRKASAEARIDFQQKRLAVRDFVINATKSIELDRLQYLRKQIEVGATMNDLEKSGVLSFDVRVAGKLIFDV